jgi:hypothetical protein
MMRRSILASAAVVAAVAGFVGVAASPASADGLPVVSEKVTINPNNPVGPGSLVSLCLVPQSLGQGGSCIQL